MKEKDLFPLKINNETHSCSECVHYGYCRQTKESLVDNVKEVWVYQGKRYIPIPRNCPILSNCNDREKVIFT